MFSQRNLPGSGDRTVQDRSDSTRTSRAPGNSRTVLGTAAQAQLNTVAKEQDASASMVVSSTQIRAGEKRKDAAAKTLDPRKRPRLLSPEDQDLQAKIEHQERQISQLRSRLSKAAEDSRTMRNADELELQNMRTCLEALIKKVDVNQELIRKLESDVELKAETIQTASAALEARTKELSAAEETIGRTRARLEYLERDRNFLKADVHRYHKHAREISAHCEHLKARQRLEKEWWQQQQSQSLSCTSGVELRPTPLSEPGRDVHIPERPFRDGAKMRVAHLPESRARFAKVDGRNRL